jgi:hypothetical protein
MFNISKKKAIIYKVVYNFMGEKEIRTRFASSCGLASLKADPLIEILEITKV